MDRSTWKKFEGRVAAMFGTKRAPLSGINGGVTASDSLSDKFFIEVKMRRKHALWTLYDSVRDLAKKEGKVPVIAVGETSRKGAIICIHSDNLHRVSELLKEIDSDRYGNLPRGSSDTSGGASITRSGSNPADT